MVFRGGRQNWHRGRLLQALHCRLHASHMRLPQPLKQNRTAGSSQVVQRLGLSSVRSTASVGGMLCCIACAKRTGGAGKRGVGTTGEKTCSSATKMREDLRKLRGAVGAGRVGVRSGGVVGAGSGEGVGAFGRAGVREAWLEDGAGKEVE